MRGNTVRAVVVAAVVASASLLTAAPAAAQDHVPYGDTPVDAFYTAPVTALAESGVFEGTECGDGFCPDEPMDRATMAVWMVRVLDGADPAPVTSTRFADVDGSHPHAAFIARFAEIGVTQGCGDGTNFCPDAAVDRAQMATFLSRAYSLPEGRDPGFGDVVAGAWYATAVARLASSGITAGCGDGTNFCPDRPTTRGQMATFLYRAEHHSKRACKPPSKGYVTAGFPLMESAAPSSGRVDLTVLFMDFPDAPATYPTHEEIEPGLAYMEQYLEASSYGRLQLEIDVVHRWLRSSEPSTEHIAPDAAGASGLWPSAGAESVRLADDSYDFSETDIVLTIFPSAHFWGGLALGSAYADGQSLSTFRINTHPYAGDSPWNWGLVGAHELVHNFGLLDHYPYDYSRHAQPDWPSMSFRLGLMGLQVQSPQDFEVSTSYVTMVEMLSWSRWQLGWLDPWKMECLTGDAAVEVLDPIARPGRGTAMIAVPLNEHELIVIENRRALGYDYTVTPAVEPGSGPSGSNRYREDWGVQTVEGVLVYTVDARLDTGELPLKVAGDTGNGQIGRFPLLTVGESIAVRGYTIAVTEDDGHAYTVAIRPSG